MKIKKVILTNFRGYTNSTEINFNDLTVFVGRNEIGKSTVLEALDLFFNDGKGVVKFDKNDVSVGTDITDYTIEIIFEGVPETVIVDSTYQTSLTEEYLLTTDGELDIIKKFGGGTKCSGTYVRCYHPTNPACERLHLKKLAELKKIIQEQGINCENLTVNAVMRKAIWNHHIDDLQLNTIEIDITKGDDTKRIWNKLSQLLPVYSLFRSDRENSDGDKEVQDPLKAAVVQFFSDAEIQQTLDDVAERVTSKLKDVAQRTLEKLKEMDPDVADSLTPVIPNPKWSDVFKGVSITAEDDIPINKRGSGIKRLVLLNFFRAEAEKRQQQSGNSGIIYAIEEPETSQHFSNQRILADALIALSKAPNTQVILTTHSGVIVKKLEFADLRLVSEDVNKNKYITSVESGLLFYPSLNEVNYTAFGEVTEEYHDELWSVIEKHGWMAEYKNGKQLRPYNRLERNGTVSAGQHTLSHYIRDVMHHPENTHNTRYTYDELKQSVLEMRSFIKGKFETQAVWIDED